MNFLITPSAPYSFVWDGVAIGGITAYGEPLKRFGFAMNVAISSLMRGGVSDSMRPQSVPPSTTRV